MSFRDWLEAIALFLIAAFLFTALASWAL